MTEKEIMKALKICKDANDVSDCENCPYRNKDGYFGVGCRQKMMKDAFDLIFRIYNQPDDIRLMTRGVKHDEIVWG